MSHVSNAFNLLHTKLRDASHILLELTGYVVVHDKRLVIDVRKLVPPFFA
jgi:hypothetical protein